MNEKSFQIYKQQTNKEEYKEGSKKYAKKNEELTDIQKFQIYNENQKKLDDNDQQKNYQQKPKKMFSFLENNQLIQRIKKQIEKKGYTLEDNLNEEQKILSELVKGLETGFDEQKAEKIIIIRGRDRGHRARHRGHERVRGARH